MSGHSKWSSIKHKKAAKDAKRGKLFTKLIKEISVAARNGGDVNANPRLRTAVLTARAASLPNDTIERAIKKGSGQLEGQVLEEIDYEGYGPGGIAVIVEVLTDNRNRTAGEVRAAFTKSGGHLAETGAVSFMFDRVGLIEYEAKAAGADAMLEAAIEAGAEDVVSNENGHEIYTTQDS